MKAFSLPPKFIHRILLSLLCITPFLLIAFSCDNSAPPPLLNSAGEYSKCLYADGLKSPGYSSATVYYPCEKGDGPYAATTLTGGWINTKEDISWLADHLVTHGYVIIAMTPVDNMGDNEQWQRAHKAGLKKLIDENKRDGSPIKGIVDTDNLQIMGFSKGGGGALLAAADMGDKIKSTQALAPYMDHEFELGGIRSATFCYSGTEDLIASRPVVVDIFEALPESIDRAMVILNEITHLDWMNDGKHHDRLKTFVTAWMKAHLGGDEKFKTYFKNTKQWLREYKYNDADGNEESSGCG